MLLLLFLKKFLKNTGFPIDKQEKYAIITPVPFAGVAHPVERHLAKVEVASSSLVTRSIKKRTTFVVLFFMGENQAQRCQ